MAQRYGGKFSPGADAEPSAQPKDMWQDKRRSKAGGRVNLLFIAPLPLAIRAFFQDPAGLATNLVAFGVLLLAAWMTREGILAQEAYDARKIARRPALPRKILGSVLTGAGLFLAGLGTDGSLAAPVIFGLLGLVLHSASFGLDPLRNKGMDGIDLHQQDRVARAVGTAEKHLTGMKDAIARVRLPALERRVDQFQATARDMFRTVEEDPRDLRSARRYLGVYLQGARDATVKFADIYTRTKDQKALQDYEALLDDLEKNFSNRTTALLEDNKNDMNVEIEVLRERLEREGIRTETE